MSYVLPQSPKASHLEPLPGPCSFWMSPLNRFLLPHPKMSPMKEGKRKLNSSGFTLPSLEELILFKWGWGWEGPMQNCSCWCTFSASLSLTHLGLNALLSLVPSDSQPYRKRELLVYQQLWFLIAEANGGHPHFAQPEACTICNAKRIQNLNTN